MGKSVQVPYAAKNHDSAYLSKASPTGPSTFLAGKRAGLSPLADEHNFLLNVFPGFEVGEGHILACPNEHPIEQDYILRSPEKQAPLDMMQYMKPQLDHLTRDEEARLDAFFYDHTVRAFLDANEGVEFAHLIAIDNDGYDAGQNVPHVHRHFMALHDKMSAPLTGVVKAVEAQYISDNIERIDPDEIFEKYAGIRCFGTAKLEGMKASFDQVAPRLQVHPGHTAITTPNTREGYFLARALTRHIRQSMRKEHGITAFSIFNDFAADKDELTTHIVPYDRALKARSGGPVYMIRDWLNETWNEAAHNRETMYRPRVPDYIKAITAPEPD